MQGRVESQTDCKKIARSCIAVRIRLLSRVITAIYDDVLRPYRITINQLNVLVAVSRLGSASAKQLGQVLYMDPSTLSRNLERMRKDGLLRITAGKDPRTHSIRITAKAERLIEKSYLAWERAQEKAIEILGENHLQAILEMASGIWSRHSAV